MPLGVYKYILRLQIPVGHPFSFVQKLQYEYNLGGVELGCGLVESTSSSQIAKYLASRAVVKLGMSALSRRGGTKGPQHTSMYNESWSWKLDTRVVMNGCPATAASTLRSFRTCSTCLRRITDTWPLAAAGKTLEVGAYRRLCGGSSEQKPCPRLLVLDW
jgi:hypothetical protein